MSIGCEVPVFELFVGERPTGEMAASLARVRLTLSETRSALWIRHMPGHLLSGRTVTYQPSTVDASVDASLGAPL
jgi:hypothetical protein